VSASRQVMPVSAILAGFYGKLPARGDFVRFGLPRDFTDPWDSWLQSVIAGSQAQMGERWLPAFLESPVWRFALPAGLCGSSPVLGLMLPSVDRAGRYFPLSFAALAPVGDDAPEMPEAAAWLDRCEAAGRTALEHDATPEQIAAMLGSPRFRPPATSLSHSLWWTEGSPRVPPSRFAHQVMPDAAAYATMLGAGQPGSDAAETAGCVAWGPSS